MAPCDVKAMAAKDEAKHGLAQYLHEGSMLLLLFEALALQGIL